ncbi:MAG: hypothetical protein KDA77_17890, partial [Planctomycetaceae bacterium]|nr:hypothetical protein [Planctomycetaceae bacterium]
VAPLILAKQLEWTPPVVDERGSQLFSQILAGTLVILIIGVAFAMWKASQKDKQFRESRLKTSEEQISFGQLESQPAAPQSESKSKPESISEPKTETKTEPKTDDKTPE